jgi:hypothetical protein
MKLESYVCRILFGGALVIGISGCGKGGDEKTAFKTPATVEQAATIFDLSTFPVDLILTQTPNEQAHEKQIVRGC